MNTIMLKKIVGRTGYKASHSTHAQLLNLVRVTNLTFLRSSDFQPSFASLHELIALLPSGTPMIAVTATVNATTHKDIIQKLDMNGCTFVYASPDRPNICYSVKPRTDLSTDLTHVLDNLKTNSIKAIRVIIYCKSLNMCADLYARANYNVRSLVI